MEHVRFPKKHFFKMRNQIIEERTRALQGINLTLFKFSVYECSL